MPFIFLIVDKLKLNFIHSPTFFIAKTNSSIFSPKHLHLSKPKYPIYNKRKAIPFHPKLSYTSFCNRFIFIRGDKHVLHGD